MLFQEATPNTSVYMYAGYAVFFVVTIIYLASLAIRNHNLEQDLQTLEDMEKEQKNR